MYIILRSDDISELEAKVNKHLKEGFKVTGGVCTVAGSYGYAGRVEYFQAVYLDTEPQ